MSTPSECASLPLHAKSIPAMCIERVLCFLRPESRKRVQSIFSLLSRAAEAVIASPESFPTPVLPPLSPLDQSVLVDCGLVSLCSSPLAPVFARGNATFTVTEHRPEGSRRRWILWTAAANAALSALGYVPDVPLSFSLMRQHAVSAPPGSLACLRDLAVSFFQLELPDHLRPLFSFFGPDGEVYAPLRLPMGCAASVELLQTLLSGVSGMPSVSSCPAPASVSVSVWVDNLRLLGPADAVGEHMAIVDARARECGMSWKPSDSLNGQVRYGYVGLEWRHPELLSSSSFASSSSPPAAVQVRPSAKLRRAVASAVADAQRDRCLPAAAFERLVCRLVWSSVACAEPRYARSSVLFPARRACHLLNSSSLSPSDPFFLSAAAVRGLVAWSADLEKWSALRRDDATHAADVVLFADASVRGWGAVVLTPEGARSAGGPWREDRAALSHRDISRLEAEAMALAVEALLPVGARAELRTDNTAVLGAARKGTSSCGRISRALLRVGATVRRRGAKIVGWAHVRSEENPADAPSRVW